jgi:hypothetical protein
MGLATIILFVASLHLLGIAPGLGPFGASWTIAAGFLFATGHFAAMTALATHFHGVRSGYRQLRPMVQRFARILTLETLLIAGCGMVFAALIGFVLIAIYWSNSGFRALPNTLPLVLASVLGATGAQTIFGGFLLAIIAGHRADFASEESGLAYPRPRHA